MTDYNERLDEVLSNLYNSAWVEGSNYEENNPEGSDIPSKREIAKTAAAKQAITSLTKELVAEAKPEKKSTEDYGSWEEGHRNAGWNNCLEHYEQNLLKALEEV